VARETDAAEVLAAARRRAQALVARDAAALTALHHPALQWTTFRGAVLDRAAYVRSNTAGDLVWRAQELVDPVVAVADETAVLTAVARDDVERDGRLESYTLRLTQTWVRGETGWRCLAGHAGPELEGV
jgi:ketosteroid isomerase-like protein